MTGKAIMTGLVSDSVGETGSAARTENDLLMRVTLAARSIFAAFLLTLAHKHSVP
jgi:hypothetical protein